MVIAAMIFSVNNTRFHDQAHLYVECVSVRSVCCTVYVLFDMCVDNKVEVGRKENPVLTRTLFLLKSTKGTASLTDELSTCAAWSDLQFSLDSKHKT